MKTLNAQPDHPLPQEGDVCLRCQRFWEAMRMPPKQLVALRRDGEIIRTENKGIPLLICPHCDGTLILND